MLPPGEATNPELPRRPQPAIPSSNPKLLDQVRREIRLRHYSLRTEEAYVDWIKLIFCVTVSPRTCLKPATTFAPSRNYSGTSFWNSPRTPRSPQPEPIRIDWWTWFCRRLPNPQKSERSGPYYFSRSGFSFSFPLFGCPSAFRLCIMGAFFSISSNSSLASSGVRTTLGRRKTNNSTS